MAEGTQDALAFGPDVRIGFLGGGQLGRMTIQAALDLDMRIEVLDPDPQCPCARIAHQFTQGDLNDAEAVIAWGRSLDVVTVEIENVSTEGLTALKAMGVKVLPDPAHLAMIRDKGIQKQFYAEHGIPTSDFALVEDGRAESMSRGLPVVQKLRTGGYDGRGVQVIRTEEEARYAFDAPSVLEDAVDIEKELSVIVARSTSGEVKTYPVVESVFNALNLVDYLVAPARISEAVEAEAQRIALSVVEAMDFVGLLAVELFLDKGGPNPGQRSGPPRPQFRPPHHRGLRHVPIRTAPPRHPGPAPGRHCTAFGRSHAQPDWWPRRQWRPALHRFGGGTRRTRTSPAHLRQGGRPRGPEDGPRHRVGRLSRCGRATRPRLRDHISTVHAH